MPFYWIRKKDNYKSQLDGVGQTAHTVIADYIEKNKNKSAKDLRNVLEIRKHATNTWAKSGGHPFTLVEHATIKNNFPEVIRLNGGEEIRISRQWGVGDAPNSKWKKLVDKMDNLGYTILAEDEEAPSPPVENRNLGSQKTSREVSLLQQFKQIILYGPPGTGKTYLAREEILPQLLGMNKDEVVNWQGDRWDIVQFHPSYNYEDFVRGVKVETVDNNVAYKTENRTFGDICKRAEDDSDNNYVLIIDEINRANVSAVLGELIYALEYRGEKIKTPYTIDGEKDSMLVIPKNLYVIGTMNTADRTIGQIDYAVRRRFAFVYCPPDKSVIKNNDARNIFSKVDAIFNDYTSPDYDADDVRIGHSYFMAEGDELAHKIFYQILPILWEYVKDGVLTKEAEPKILEVADRLKFPQKDELKGKSDAEPTEEHSQGTLFFYWEREGKICINNIGRTILSIIHDYVEQNSGITFEKLLEWFPDEHKEDIHKRVIQPESAIAYRHGVNLTPELTDMWNKERFFTDTEDKLQLEDQNAYLSRRDWYWIDDYGVRGSTTRFRGDMEEKGYKIRKCHVVNIQEIDKKRSWDACRDFGFVSASGVKKNGNSRTIGLQEIKEGDIVFAFLLADADKNKGFIGMGEVLEKAVPINQFKVDGTPILNCLCKDGQKYRKKYSVAAEHAGDEQKREWMVSIDWLRVIQREDAEGSSARHVTFAKVSSSNLKIIKKKFEGVE